VSHLRGFALELQAAFSMGVVPDYEACGSNGGAFRQKHCNIQWLGQVERNRCGDGHAVTADIDRRTFNARSRIDDCQQDRNFNCIPEIASTFSQHQVICNIQSLPDRAGFNWSVAEESVRGLPELAGRR